ncbi:WD40/YVTN/BNR-like repeat-containing protein [Novipirellula artificiosorum]|uniref:Ycf48-like protein n=1 Tax=Novipirellula artificiosorum TaxID=2528016 RepID=A0A5C6D927_9BACT|nr:hypothetical protein [Novipirellula artificiosorum]TWU33248.1 Ycf48-like protein [Novipirellula artificiosorum]
MQLTIRQTALCIFLACMASIAHAHVPHDIIYSLDVSPNFHEDGLVFASSTQFGEAHLVSTNFGETFSESHAGMDRTLVTGHTFSPSFREDGTVLRSDDSGRSWQEVFRRTNDYVCKIAFSPYYAEDGTIAVGTAKGFVFLSENEGEDWQLRSNGLNRWVHHTDILVTRLLFSPDYKKDRTLLLGKTTGFYKTTDGGDFWRHINVWNTKWGYYVYPAPGGASRDVFTATYNSGISRSRDLGSTWESANIGITSAFANGMQLSPAYDKDKTIFVIDISTGLYRSTDAGHTWSQIPELDISRYYNQPVLHRELGVSHQFADDGILLMFTVPRHILDVEEKFVWKYNDKTREIKRVIVGSESNYINAFAFPPVGSKKNLMFCASGQGVFRSQDKGDTWEHVFRGNASQIFVSPNFDKDGLVLVMNAGGQLHSSRDWGATFGSSDFNLNEYYINNLVFSPTYAADNTLYATTFGERVLRSVNGGKTWNYFGLKGKFLYTGLTFSGSYAEDGTIFAPAIDGIYRSTNRGKDWENVLNPTQFLAKVPFVTLKDADGQAISITFGDEAMMRQYDSWDPEISPQIYRRVKNGVQMVSSPNAYLGQYYKFRVDFGYAFEVYFYGTGIEYKCVQDADLGIAEIFLDGESQGRLDLYHATETCDVTGYRSDDLEAGIHTLRVEATGHKNANSRGTAISFNAANITN